MNINKTNYNRAIIILLLGILITAWVMVNAGGFEKASFIYITLGIISIILYLSWDKIRPFGK